MAIGTPVLTASRFDAVNTATLLLPASGSFSLVADRLYVAFAGAGRSGGPGDLSTGFTFTHSGTGKTWNFIAQTAVYGASLRRFAAYWYIPPSTETAITVTFDPAGGTNSCNVGALIEIPSGFVVATPIAQSKAGEAAGTTSLSVALDAAPTAGNLSLFGCYTYGVSSGALDPRTDWTELSDDAGQGTASDSGHIETQYKTALDAEQTASVSVASTTREWGGIHLEIAATGGAPADPLPPLMMGSFDRRHGILRRL